MMTIQTIQEKSHEILKKTVTNQHRTIIALKAQHALDLMEIQDLNNTIKELNSIIDDLNDIIERMIERGDKH